MILIVDKNREDVFNMKALLALHHFDVDTASSAQEALRKIVANSYVVAIVNGEMSDVEDLASSGTPIIFISLGLDCLEKPIDTGSLLSRINVFSRLSEQSRQLSELLKDKQRLEESNHELQQFAFIASHDLQEPLRKIQTFSGLVLDNIKGTDDQVKPYLGKILASATRLRNLVNDLLQYSKIYIDEEFVPIDLNIMIGEIMSDLELQIELKHCTFDISRLPVIEGIPFQMRQVFQNLLSNSIKFSKGNSRCLISVTGEHVSEKSFDALPTDVGQYCRFVVTDNGVGFDNEFRGRIFDLFHRLKNRNRYEGTGIGLAIVKKVVERHDGIIDAWGEENEGARFTIVLPIHSRPIAITATQETKYASSRR